MADANSPDEDISPRVARASRSGRVQKSPKVTLADLGDVEGFGRKGEEDQLYAFQLANEVYKRKEGIISGDGLTQLQANLDLGGNRIVRVSDPTEAQEAATKGYVDSRICVHQVTSTLAGSYYWQSLDEETKKLMWLEAPGGYKLKRMRMARMPPWKSIYNGRIVLLNLWVGLEPTKTFGLEKVTKFSTFQNTTAYMHFLEHEEGEHFPAKGFVLIQGE